MTPSLPPRVIAAARRLSGPSTVLARSSRFASGVALGGGLSVWAAIAIGRGLAAETPVGSVAAIILLVVLLVPAWWLRHAGEVFDELARLPAWLATNANGPTFTLTESQTLPGVRTGGAFRAVRTVRTTVRELGEFLGPITNVIEVAAPPFWIWTGSAIIAMVVLASAGPIALLALALF